MNSKSSGGRLEGFFTGKGFYIVLFLCAAVIGVSAWMMAAGDRAMEEEISEMNRMNRERQRVETVILPPQATAPAMEAAAPALDQASGEDAQAADESTEVWREEEAVPAAAAPVYVWPLEGELERGHSVDTLKYDLTMRDWRTHAGIDIAAPLGSTVTAAHQGVVDSVRQDDLYGTVVTVDQGDGIYSIYANLAETPAVEVGNWVEPGTVIGSVGTTALSEVGQPPHLHFALSCNGESLDPLAYLPG